MSNVSYSPPSSTRGRADDSSRACTHRERVTKSLLGFGIIAGPFYVTVSLIQAALRDGFDLTRHAWSQLANGPGGWVQVVNLMLSGAMVVAAAVGYRNALSEGVGRRWVPRLLAGYGLGLILAGIFPTDPMAGFPVGTPDGPPVAPSLNGLLHLVFAGLGFVALIAAAFVLARRFHRQGRTARAAWSAMTGAAFAAAFVGLSSGSSSPAVVLAFVAAVILAWFWLSATSLHLYRNVR